MFSPPTLVDLFTLRSEAESDLSHVNIEMLLDLMFHRGSTSSLGVLLCETQVVHAVQLQNEKPDGHFWLGANYGGAAEHSTIQGLATGNDSERNGNGVEVRPGISEWQRLHGAWSGLSERSRDSWWRSEKAVEEMEKGLPFGEPNAFLHLHLAEAYKKVGRNNDARRELKKILDITPDQKLSARVQRSLR